MKLVTFHLSFWLIFTCICSVFLVDVGLKAQCPTSTFYKAGSATDLIVSATEIKLGTDLRINADPAMTAAVKSTIKYRVGYFGSGNLAASDFACSGSVICTSSVNTALIDDLDFKIVSSPDVVLGFNKVGVYTIIQVYVSGGINYYNCKTIYIYQEPEFTIKTCNCTIAVVNIPKSAVNSFYDEVEVSFLGTPNKITVKKADYGSFINNTTPYPYAGSGPCPAQNTSKAIQLVGIKKITSSPDFRLSSPSTPIDFTDNFNRPGIVHHAEELRHEANGDFIFKSERFVDIIEVSYNGPTGTWARLPVASYFISNGGKTFTIKGVAAIPNQELCFRGNAESPCGNTIPDFMRPMACMTGEIKAITDEFNFTTARRDVIINIEPVKAGGVANVIINLDKGNEAILNSRTLVFRNENADCLPNEYRVKSSYNSTTFASKKTLIYSKPQDFSLASTTTKPRPVPGILSVSIKQTGYLNTDLSAIIKHEKTFPIDAKINYYGADAGNLTTFTKLNPAPLNLNNFQDKTPILNTDSKCYQITYLDQCNLESEPTQPICTTLLKGTGSTLDWNKANIATNQPISPYIAVSDYTVEEVDCAVGSCVATKVYQTTTANSISADVADILPDVKHFAYLRITANTATGIKSVSNIYKYFFAAKLYIPTSFSPNGDGINDDLKANGVHVGDFTMKIYNRWGSLVHTISSFTNTWDGQDAETGAYIYEAEATDLSGTATSKIKQKGIIWLVR